jgi:hypothetical protein
MPEPERANSPIKAGPACFVSSNSDDSAQLAGRAAVRKNGNPVCSANRGDAVSSFLAAAKGIRHVPVGYPKTIKPGSPEARKPGSPETRKPGSPETRKPGNPETRKPGNPLCADGAVVVRADRESAVE